MGAVLACCIGAVLALRRWARCDIRLIKAPLSRRGK